MRLRRLPRNDSRLCTGGTAVRAAGNLPGILSSPAAPRSFPLAIVFGSATAANAFALLRIAHRLRELRYELHLTARWGNDGRQQSVNPLRVTPGKAHEPVHDMHVVVYGPSAEMISSRAPARLHSTGEVFNAIKVKKAQGL